MIRQMRVLSAMRKMAPGTMGGESRVATPPSPGDFMIVSGGFSPCECLLWVPTSYGDEVDNYVLVYTYGAMTIIGARIYCFDTANTQVLSIGLTNHLDLTLELDNFFSGYLTADNTGRIWLDGVMSLGEDPADPNGTFPYSIRPLDDPLNESARIITEHLVASGDQVANTFYRSVPRWLGWHPADGNFYWWQQWNMPTGSSPRYNEGRMVQVTPGGVATTVFTIGPRTSAQGFSLASEYRQWVPTLDGGLWCAYRDPITKGDYWLRRYDIADWSYQDFTDIDATGADFWPTPGESDSITLYIDSTWPTPFKFQVINSSGVVSNSQQPCLADDVYEATWSPQQDRIVLFGWDYDDGPYNYLSTFDLTGRC